LEDCEDQTHLKKKKNKNGAELIINVTGSDEEELRPITNGSSRKKGAKKHSKKEKDVTDHETSSALLESVV